MLWGMLAYRLSSASAILALGLSGLGCSAPSEIVVVVGVVEAPPGWVDTVRITIDGDRTFDTPVTDDLRLPLSLGVTSDGAGELNAVAEGLRGGVTVARQEGQMDFLPGRRLLLHLYLSPDCAGTECEEDITCHLGACIRVRRDACTFVTLPDNGSDIECASVVGMDAGVPDAGDLDGDVSDGGDAGPVECLDAMACDDSNPCTVDRCDAGTCVHDPAEADTPCEDGLYCNGVDTCEGETCIHGGLSCPAPMLCDEVNDRCVTCLGDTDCVRDKVDSSSCPPCGVPGTHDVRYEFGTCVTSTGMCDMSTPSGSEIVTDTCPGPIAADGAVCGTGSTEHCCSGACVNLGSNALNCGGCGITCGGAADCLGGRCGCPSPTACPPGQACNITPFRCYCDAPSDCAAGQRCDVGLCTYG